MIHKLSMRRLARLAFVVVKHLTAHAVVMAVRRRAWLARRLPVQLLSGPERLRVAIEEMGGTFIKFGQMLALQPDILPLPYCNALFNLLDRVSPFPYEEVERVFIEEFERSPHEIFDHIETKPLATASIGQVHVAYLDGRKLAVKVQRPKVEVDFAGDIRLMAATIRLIKRLRVRSLYWLLEPMGEFLAWTREELDYRFEARYMERLRLNSRDNPRERVPEVVWRYTSRRTLVSEFFEGETLLSYLRALESDDYYVHERLSELNFEPDLMARNIIDNFLGDVFSHGMFHADLHPANLMILPDNTVGYIDFGITGTISRYSRQNLVALTLAYTRGDLDGMCEAFFRISVLDSEASAERFRAGLRLFAESWYETEGRDRRLRKNFTLVMLDMLRLSRRAGVWPERDVVKYIRSAIAIDGLITRFAPSFDLGTHLQTVCDSHLRWSVRREMFNYDSIMGWAISGQRIMSDGPLRASDFIQRAAIGDLQAHAELVGTGGGDDYDEGSRRKVVHLGMAIFIISVVAATTEMDMRLGINLFTAELLFIVTTASLLLRTVRRLA